MTRMAEAAYLDVLAEYLCAARLDEFPPGVVERGRWIIVDCLGAIVAGTEAEEMRRLVRLMRPGGAGGGASLVGHGHTADPRLAALINGSAGTWLELDECNLVAKGHPAIQVMPAALAVAEETGAPGRDFLRAVILGYEVAARIGRAAQMRHALHPHGTHGAVGAAVAVALLARYRPAQMRHLINIAATLGLATSRRAVVEGATVRNVYAGMSGHMGILAERLARTGFTGEDDGLGSIYGSLYGDSFERDLVVRDLGDEFLIAASCFRLHPCAIQIQSPLNLVSEVMARRPGGLHSKDIERMEIWTYAYAAALSHRSVSNSFGARYSIPFAVASLIHHGRPGLRNFDQRAVVDRAVHRLAERVHVIESRDLTARYPCEQPCRLLVELKDGTRIEATTAYTRGERQNAHHPAAIRDKFLALASRAWGSAGAEAVLGACMSLEDMPDMGALIPA